MVALNRKAIVLKLKLYFHSHFHDSLFGWTANPHLTGWTIWTLMVTLCWRWLPPIFSETFHINVGLVWSSKCLIVGKPRNFNYYWMKVVKKFTSNHMWKVKLKSLQPWKRVKKKVCLRPSQASGRTFIIKEQAPGSIVIITFIRLTSGSIHLRSAFVIA